MIPPKYDDQPSSDIHKYMRGYAYSIRHYKTYLDPEIHYSKSYKAGRIAGHKRNKLTNLVTGKYP